MRVFIDNSHPIQTNHGAPCGRIDIFLSIYELTIVRPRCTTRIRLRSSLILCFSFIFLNLLFLLFRFLFTAPLSHLLYGQWVGVRQYPFQFLSTTFQISISSPCIWELRSKWNLLFGKYDKLHIDEVEAPRTVMAGIAGKPLENWRLTKIVSKL